MQDLNWQDLRHVLAVARAGALAAAARGLKVDETTVARRLARTEARSACGCSTGLPEC
jgi:DNA-binding transcriptional LysR family regulator